MKTLAQTLMDRSVLVPWSGCRIWEWYCDKNGYGQIRRGGSLHWAHRAAYQVFNGDIPDGLHVLHRCDVPSCINPKHLFVGTNVENIIDSMDKGRRKGIHKNRPTGLKYKRLNENAHDCKRKIKKCEWPNVVASVASGVPKTYVAQSYGVSAAVIHRIWNQRDT